jgi:hypothetical protein
MEPCDKPKLHVLAFPPEILSEIFTYAVSDVTCFTTFCLECLHYKSHRAKFNAAMKNIMLPDVGKSLFCAMSIIDPYIKIRGWHWKDYTLTSIRKSKYNSYSNNFNYILRDKQLSSNLKQLTINDIYAKYCCHFNLYTNLTKLTVLFSIDIESLVQMPNLLKLTVVGLTHKTSRSIISNIKNLKFRRTKWQYIKPYPEYILPNVQMFPQLEKFAIVYEADQSNDDSYTKVPIGLTDFQHLAAVKIGSKNIPIDVNFGQLESLKKVHLSGPARLEFNQNYVYKHLDEISTTDIQYIVSLTFFTTGENFMFRYLHISLDDIKFISTRNDGKHSLKISRSNLGNWDSVNLFANVNVYELDMMVSPRPFEVLNFGCGHLSNLNCLRLNVFDQRYVDALVKMPNLETLQIGMLCDDSSSTLDVVLRIPKLILEIFATCDGDPNEDMYDRIERQGQYICDTYEKIRSEKPTRICKELIWNKPCVKLTAYAKRVGLVFRRYEA